jgi:pteridine reductase
VEKKSGNMVALVTGAGRRRVGNVIAQTLAARGYSIALHYFRSAEEARQTTVALKERGVHAQAFQADISREADVDRLFQQTADHFGRLDVLVTAAAIWESKPLETVTAEDVRRHFETNTLGTFLCCQKAGLLMVQQPEGGAIVTLGDWATERPYPGYAAYFPSKGAIPALTRAMAVEFARRNPRVRVNCILPGPVMLPDSLGPQERQEAIAGTLVRREGRPQDVAHAVLFLVENEFVTGVCLPVDGGRTIAGCGEQTLR